MSAHAVSHLDRPIWASLASSHAHLGFGDALARRYVPDVVPFAAVASETPAAFEALRRLLQPHEHVGLLCEVAAAELHVPNATDGGVILQMVADAATFADVAADDRDVLALGDADAPEMLALAQHARPGPFGARTHETGRYIGMRDQGRLVAMAGERMRFDGHVEISAVCVDDAWRGRGLAGRLVRTLGRQIVLRGDTPFLHVYRDNAGAAALYERLGFAVRRSFFVVQVGAAG